VSGAEPRDRRKAAKDALLARLGYRFNDPDLFERALTHASTTGGTVKKVRDNERLEFLGDRVLGLAIADRLTEAFPTADEGELSRRLHALVRREACAEVAREMGLGEALRLAPGESNTGGRDKATVLGDACEALIAAVYRDGGTGAARALIDRFWGPRLHQDAADAKDAKSALQEWAQGQGRGIPQYEVVRRSGPDHAPRFTVQVAVGRADPAVAEGSSRQDAEKAAAAALLQREISQ
jgi:ribonuclease-3